MRLALVISSLGAGGAERVLATLANHWAGRGDTVTLITLADGTADFYPLDERIRRVPLGLAGRSGGLVAALRANLARLWALRRAIHAARADYVVSFGDKTNVLTLLTGWGVPVIISERIDPRQHPIGRVWSALRRGVYPLAAGLVVQTEAVKSWAAATFPALLVTVIPNPVNIPPPSPIPRSRSVLGMGRLVRQKGFDLLLQACAGYDDVQVTILGEGDERSALQAQAAALGVTLHLPGVVQDPAAWLAEAAVFALPSRYEGFPNALLEAMAGGGAVVAANCPSGPAEIITDGVDGLLVPTEDAAALGAALRRLLDDPPERARLGKAARQTVLSRYSLGAIAAQWDALFERVRP